MSQTGFRPKVYVKTDCPFSFKFLTFLAESGLSRQFDIMDCEPGSEKIAAVRVELEAKTGKSPAFPTVELAAGEFKSDSDDLIQHYADLHGIDVDSLPVLDVYKRGVFTTYIKMVKKIKSLDPEFFS